MRTRPLSDSFGVEVLDFDLPESWEEAAEVELRELFREHHLLLFREPDLPPENQVALMRAVGLTPDDISPIKGCYYGHKKIQSTMTATLEIVPR